MVGEFARSVAHSLHPSPSPPFFRSFESQAAALDTFPDIRRRNALQKMGTVVSEGGPRQQQGEEEDPQPAPLHLTAHPTLPLSLLAVAQSYRGMCFSAQLCNVKGAALFSFVRLPPLACHPFAGAPVHDMSLTHGERLRVVARALTGMLVRLLSLCTGCSSTTTTLTVSTTTVPPSITATSTTTTITTTVTTHYFHFEPQSYRRACHKLMQGIVRRVAAQLMHSLAAAAGSKADKEAEELCVSGQCAAAMVALKLAVYCGHVSSRALMANMMLDGREGVAKDWLGAVALLKEGQRLGCHHCQGLLAWGCMLSPNRANWGNCQVWLQWARESSTKGSRFGQYMLGQYYEGRCDYAQAVALYRLAAAQTLDKAQLRLGHMHFNGFGVAQDFTEALRLYQLAAAQGEPQALYDVAACYDNGKGARQNRAEAVLWYRRAQAAGHGKNCFDGDVERALQRAAQLVPRKSTGGERALKRAAQLLPRKSTGGKAPRTQTARE